MSACFRANSEDARVAQKDAQKDARDAQKSSPEHWLEQREGPQDGVEMLSADTIRSHTLR
jgi:hypothetical protein